MSAQNESDDIPEIKRQVKATLLELVDNTALEFVVATLAAICHEKAAHIRTMPRDGTASNAARSWGYNAVALDRAVSSIVKGLDD